MNNEATQPEPAKPQGWGEGKALSDPSDLAPSGPISVGAFAILAGKTYQAALLGRREVVEERIREMQSAYHDATVALAGIANPAALGELLETMREIAHFGMSVPLGMSDAEYERYAARAMRSMAQAALAAIGALPAGDAP